jgi:acyl-CoA dehydrogenase
MGVTGWLLSIIIIAGFLAYHRTPLKIWSGALFLLLAIYTYFSHHYFLGILFIIFILPLNISLLRRKLISQKIFNWYKKNTPKMSRTEREALEAGTVSWEAELFNGKPDFKKYLSIPAAKLSDEEKAFIEGPVEKLCDMINDWEITHQLADLPESIWKFLKDEGFFGLIIPKQYGGKEFSNFAHSEILCKVYGISVTAGTTISVPNSLGPAELILHYGTDEQKKYYLPRLARGEEMPCFALTSPKAGSDAANIVDKGVICRGQFEGKEVMGIKLNWDKRYITLAPVATVLGLAFKLYDPDKLIGEEKNLGITCALIPTHLPGITIGRRHFPLNTAFLNGPTQGKDVFIPLDWIIGGIKMAGQGWRMLVECLSVGRAISLPATSIGGGRVAILTTTAYSRIRRQFNMPIGKFEGIAEVIARMSGHFYMMEAARRLTLSIIEQGEKPSVLSAIMKYHFTELGRKIGCDAMDVHGGKGICLGPKNYLGRNFQSTPIGVTVEGANILTRSLIIFGQGAIRCHRYVSAEMHAAENNNVAEFDKAFWGHLGQIISNKARAFFLGLTNGYLVKNPVLTLTTRHYYQLLVRFSSAFSLLADFSMAVLGGQLKRRERLSARLGDVLSYLYLISAILRRYEEEGREINDLPLVHWACQYYLFEIQEQLDVILQNFPHKILRLALRVIIFPLGKNLKRPSDILSQQIADIMITPSATRDRVTQGVYKGNIFAKIEEAFIKAIAAEPLLKKENLTQDEKDIIKSSEKASMEIIAVDDFSFEDLRHSS